jgi:hypothetical protein
METIARELAAELRQARARTGRTVAEAARELGWTITKLRRVEKRGLPGLDELAIMCRLYGLDLALLHQRLVGRGSSGPPSGATGVGVNRLAHRDDSGAIVIGTAIAVASDPGSAVETGPTTAATAALTAAGREQR